MTKVFYAVWVALIGCALGFLVALGEHFGWFLVLMIGVLILMVVVASILVSMWPDVKAEHERKRAAG